MTVAGEQQRLFSHSIAVFILKFVFIYFFLAVPGLHLAHGLFVAACGLSLVAARRGYSPVAVCRLLIAVAALLQSMGSRARRLQQLWHVGLVVVHGLSCTAASGLLVLGRD